MTFLQQLLLKAWGTVGYGLAVADVVVVAVIMACLGLWVREQWRRSKQRPDD